jgi:ArsR family metal-binding transcriptional regulator
MINLKDILKEETVNEKFSVQGMRAREIISTILTKTDFAAGDIKSQKEAKDMVNDLVKILNNFYEKYNIDKKIIL